MSAPSDPHRRSLNLDASELAGVLLYTARRDSAALGAVRGVSILPSHLLSSSRESRGPKLGRCSAPPITRPGDESTRDHRGRLACAGYPVALAFQLDQVLGAGQ